MVAESGGFDGDAGGTGTGPGFDEDFHVLSECHEKVHEALDGEALQLLIRERRDLRLVDAKRGGDRGLGEPLPFDNPIEGGTKPGLGVEFGRIGQAQIGKHVAAAADHLICCALSRFFSSQVNYS